MLNALEVLRLVCFLNVTVDASRRYLFKEVPLETCSGQICEILKFAEDPRSWFVGNTIQTGETKGDDARGQHNTTQEYPISVSCRVALTPSCHNYCEPAVTAFI